MKSSTGGTLLRKELWDTSYLEAHPEAYEFFKEDECYKFRQKLQGYHQGITETFPRVLMDLKFSSVLW